jgi:hypothetical protein
MNLPHWSGWHLIGRYDSDVGSWILHHEGEALLLEVPEGLPVADVQAALDTLGSPSLRYVTASHDHEDHLDTDVWAALERAFLQAKFLHPSSIRGDKLLHLAGEPVWLVKGPKHSLTDVVTVFRGVCMSGDIELGMLESVNDEVPTATKKRSMQRLRDFPGRTGYHVHTTFSAHLNDVRTGIDWPALFQYQDA